MPGVKRGVRRMLWVCTRSWVGMLGLSLVLAWVLGGLGAPWLAPFPPQATLLPFAPPGTVSEVGT
ncbi:MAG: ABC transporter permease, partial [Candidatus Tectomicrobia bacterium]|nr:ABC transporter permease [Candidatus Tectomicrobia bacterium]